MIYGVKILCIGQPAKEQHLDDGTTVEQALQKVGYDPAKYSIHVNGSPAFLTDVLSNYAVVTMVPERQ